MARPTLGMGALVVALAGAERMERDHHAQPARPGTDESGLNSRSLWSRPPRSLHPPARHPTRRDRPLGSSHPGRGPERFRNVFSGRQAQAKREYVQGRRVGKWTRSLPIRTAAELILQFSLLETRRPFTYQSHRRKGLQTQWLRHERHSDRSQPGCDRQDRRQGDQLGWPEVARGNSTDPNGSPENGFVSQNGTRAARSAPAATPGRSRRVHP